MYPANLYGTKFGFEDLPDLVTVTMWNTQIDELVCGPEEFYKVDDPYVVDGFAGELTVLYKTDDYFNEGGESAYHAMAIRNNQYETFSVETCAISEEDCGEFFNIPRSNEAKLIINNLFILFRESWEISRLFDQQFGNTSDSFPESVSISDGSINLTGNRTAKILFNKFFPSTESTDCQDFFVRPPIFCIIPPEEEEAFEGDSSLYKTSNSSYFIFYDYVFVDGVLVSDSCKWILNTPSGPIAKTGPQNSPLGTYGSFTVS
jgi:hypothetical protein